MMQNFEEELWELINAPSLSTADESKRNVFHVKEEYISESHADKAMTLVEDSDSKASNSPLPIEIKREITTTDFPTARDVFPLCIKEVFSNSQSLISSDLDSLSTTISDNLPATNSHAVNQVHVKMEKSDNSQFPAKFPTSQQTKSDSKSLLILPYLKEELPDNMPFSENQSIQSIFTKTFCKCVECGVTCANEALLKRHQKRKHAEASKRYYCNHCSYSTAVYIRHVVHVSKTHLNSTKTYKCEKCFYETSSFKGFMKHECDPTVKKNVCVFKHHRAIRYRCFECKRLFTTPYFLRNHRCEKPNGRFYAFAPGNSVRLGQFKFGRDCVYCSDCFDNKVDLRSHLKQKHPEQFVKPFKCHKCVTCLSSKQSLRIHMVRIHTKRFPFKCKLCNKGFVMKSRLKGHINKFHGIDATKSEIRAQKFYPIVAFGQGCVYCYDHFTDKLSLKKHVRESHPEEYKKPYKCDACLMCFMTVQYVNRHRRVRHSKRLTN